MYLKTSLLVFIPALASAVLNKTDETDYIASAGSLQDSKFQSWKACGPNEDCIRKRIHVCQSETTISCGLDIWKEEMYGCYTCDGIWIEESSGWSECDGTGCTDTIQTVTESCGNMAVNTECKRTLTKYCNPNKICNGTWSSWSSEDKPCQDNCETRRTRSISRTCLWNGKDSASCDKSRAPHKVTKVIYCKATNCTTTAATTTTITTTTKPATAKPTTTRNTEPTTAEIVISSQWSQWSRCNASCQQRQGFQTRNRACKYQKSLVTPPDEQCSKLKLTDAKECSTSDDIHCATTETPDKLKSTKMTEYTTTKSKKIPRAFPGYVAQIGTKAPQNTTASQAITAEGGLTKEQYQILVIALGTAAGVFVLVLLVYCMCGRRRRRNKKRRRKKLGEISVVGLESHMGFMEGMEKYGFKKSMMPTETLLTSAHPSSQSGVNSNLIPVQENQISQHIYEEMLLPHSETHQPQTNGISPMRRSVSQREKRQDLHRDDFMRRRRSCIINPEYSTPHKKAPPKPPRRSMPQLDIPNKYELTGISESSYNDNHPSLDFIHGIQPPSTTPPRTPQPHVPVAITTDHIHLSKSAPASPANLQMGAVYAAQLPFINCMSSSFLVPYGNIQMMAPMQSHGGDVIYMPSIMPIHHPHLLKNIEQSNGDQTTPLHGINDIKESVKPVPKPRPHSMGVLPTVSVMDEEKQPALTTGHNLHTITNRQTDAGSTPYQQRSFKTLHGTQDIEISSLDGDTNNYGKDIAEDMNGYVIAVKEK